MVVENRNTALAKKRSPLVNAVLAEALNCAERSRFDLPSSIAITRAQTLLKLAAGSSATAATVATLDVAVGEDGSIELTAAPPGRMVTLDISPSGSKVEMIVRDTRTGEFLASESALNDSVFVKWLEPGE